ncbi:hypothetical protein BGX34_005501 [Mortierella sp. NVP85]|nr:hypothetical protein BGX34_005501 [Mortierella sp. NVP85]
MKLNNDMFSSRSISIHRRILVKNMLTLLYQLNTLTWPHMQLEMDQIDSSDDDFTPIPLALDEEPSEAFADDGHMLLREDEQKGWMERTLSAAGLCENDEQVVPKKRDTNPFTALLKSKSTPAPSTPDPHARTPGAWNDSTTPLPRPKSSELPQSLHSYLSAVFDVNWSVELSNKEDLLFTAGPSSSAASTTSSGTSSGSPSLSSSSTVVAKRKSITVASGLSTVSNASHLASGPESTPRSSTSSTSSTFSSASSTSSVSSAGSITHTNAGSGSGAPSSSRTTTVTGTHGVQQKPLPPLNDTKSHGSSTVGNNANLVAAHGINNPSKSLPVRKASVNGHQKQVLVPGRRSSLLLAGQLLPPLPAKNPTTNTTTTLTNGNLSPSHNTLSSGLLSSPQSLAPASQPSVTPTFSKRSSSLPMERPILTQRAFSCDSHLSTPASSTTTTTATATTVAVPQANIIGLPRPLLNPAPLLSSSPPSSKTTAAPSSHSYSRSFSDDQILSRPGPANGLLGSPLPAVPKESTLSPPSLTTPRPMPAHSLKTSKSSPCLVSGPEDDSQDDLLSSALPPAPAMPNRYLPSNLSHPPAMGFMSPSGSGSPSTTGTKSLNAPLPLIPNGSMHQHGEYDPPQQHHHHHKSNSYSHGQGDGYSQQQPSMNHVNMMTGTGGGGAGVHSRTKSVDKPASTGRWNSMKMMLGLRAGAKG